MFAIKLECDKKELNAGVCQGCLSTDRRVSILRNNVDLFVSLLGAPNQFCESPILCWECIAHLKKVRMFQRRIQHAKLILQQSVFKLENDPTSPLSTLATVKKDFYDTNFEHMEFSEAVAPKPLETDPKDYLVDIIKQEEINDSMNEDDGHNFNDETFSDNELLTIDFNKLNQLDDTKLNIKQERVKKKSREIKKQSIYRYESKANITKLDVDLSDTTKHCERIILNEKEIEELLERDKGYYGYSKLPYKCENCKNVYRRSIDLKRHETFNHYESPPPRCLECKAATPCWAACRAHWRRHNTAATCPARAPRSRATCPARTRACSRAPSATPRAGERSPLAIAVRRLRYLSRSRATCPARTRACSRAPSATPRAGERSPLAIPVRRLCYLSRSRASLARHVSRSHTRLFACTECDTTCSTLREFSRHYHEKHERLVCDHCGKSFVKKKSLEIHIKRHHTPATCAQCQRTYAHYHVLENHWRMQHARARSELAYCVECDKHFPSEYKYRRHLATAARHTPPKRVRVPCPVPECGKVFARKIRMTNHYNSVHVNTTKHRCDICNKTFCSAFSARTHRQHVHDKIPMPKNKMCDICGRGFSTNRILANHRRTHTGERPYKCAHCPATFAQCTAMRTHERTQHNKGREPCASL